MEIMGAPQPEKHPSSICFTILPSLLASQEQRQQQQSQQPTAIQLHGSLSHKEQHQLTEVPSLADRLERSEENQPNALIFPVRRLIMPIH